MLVHTSHPSIHFFSHQSIPYSTPEVGKIILKSNCYEASTDESLKKSNDDETFNDDSLSKSNTEEVLNAE